MLLTLKKKKTHIDQCSRKESPEINAYIHGQLIYDRDARNIQWQKNSLFNRVGEIGQALTKE